jgi:hypothetical protein
MDIDVMHSGFKDNDVIMAIYNLQYWNAENYQKWSDFCDEVSLERPNFSVNEISKYNPNQLEMEFENAKSLQ